ncbi:MAG: YqeG family HAD IIIA-type phosphatase [Bacillota bacterium]|nr:YqeG family HAD IIIA-type phosphatase [Bacillota bacterium]
MKALTPDLWVDTLQDIPLQQLKHKGIKGLLIDIDNTLVAWDAPEPAEPIRRWVRNAHRMGFQVVLVSNNKTGRVKTVSDFLNVHGMAGAKKPTTGVLKKAMRLMKLTRPETAIIGDQIFTDVLGGNRLGITTILVTPMKSREFWWTSLVRPVERRVLRRLKPHR